MRLTEPTLLPTEAPSSVPYDRAKRVLDIASAATLLVLLAPVLGAIAGALLVAQGRPVLFRQRRTGLHGARFSMLKFRSMRPDVDRTGTASDHLRVTRIGRVLRATSLDELPNLVNVIRGEMSIVGPRPMLEQHIAHYSSADHRRRHDVRPGITGLAQVNGRNDLEHVRRFEFDLAYVARRSWMLDLHVLLRTVPTVLLRTGASGATPCPMAATDLDTASQDEEWVLVAA